MNRLLPVTFALLLAVSLLVAACAKRPALVQSAAPAPTGAAVTAPAEAAPAASPPAPVAAAPVAPRPAPKEFEARAELRAIHFDFDKYVIRPGDAKILDANAQWMKSNPDALVLIEGHCDERGTNEYNMALGDRRAKATMNYLLAQGVKSAQLSSISYGEERPLCTERNESCWSKNRRAEFKAKSR